MIDNVHDDNDETPLSSGNQHVTLHTTYGTRALPRYFGKMTFKKNGKKSQ